MKKYVLSVLMLVMSFSVFAEMTQEDIAMETCKEMARQQELSDENANTYISECLKTFEDEEKNEEKEHAKES